MNFKPIPHEDHSAGGAAAAGFTQRKIRKSGESNVLKRTEALLAHFIEDGEDMLVSDMQDLIEALHRTAMQVQQVKQHKLVAKLRKITRKQAQK